MGSRKASIPSSYVPTFWAAKIKTHQEFVYLAFYYERKLERAWLPMSSSQHFVQLFASHACSARIHWIIEYDVDEEAWKCRYFMARPGQLQPKIVPPPAIYFNHWHIGTFRVLDGHRAGRQAGILTWDGYFNQLRKFMVLSACRCKTIRAQSRGQGWNSCVAQKKLMSVNGYGYRKLVDWNLRLCLRLEPIYSYELYTVMSSRWLLNTPTTYGRN